MKRSLSLLFIILAGVMVSLPLACSNTNPAAPKTGIPVAPPGPSDKGSVGYTLVYSADRYDEVVGTFSIALSNGAEGLNVIVPDAYDSRVGIFNSSTGNFVSDQNYGNNLLAPDGIATDGSGNIYIADVGYNRIAKFDSTGKFLFSFNSTLYNPEALALDNKGFIYVLDYLNGVKKFTTQGTFVAGWGHGDFNQPNAIAVDEQGNTYVTDNGNENVTKFNAAGKEVGQFGSPGNTTNCFNNPWGVAVDGQGNIFVADLYAGVRVYNPDFSFKTYVAPGANTAHVVGVSNPFIYGATGLTLDAQGDVYVTDYNYYYYKFRPNH